MKKIIAMIALLMVSCSLSSCFATDYDYGYEDGYDEGYYAGYSEGGEDAQRWIASRVEDDLWSLDWDIEEEYGVNPWEAVEILSNYADVPDEVTEEELHQAIWAIYRYYHKSNEVINGIEDYQLD